MNVGFEDEDHFNFDMIMHEPQFNGNKQIKEEPANDNKQKKEIPQTVSRIKSKKNRKLALKKKNEMSMRSKQIKGRIEKDQNEQKVFECHHPQCEKVFLDRNSYRKHLITHGEKQFVCQAEGCGKRFLDNSKLKRHMLVHTGEKPYKCELCNKRFSLDFNLRTHLRIHTGEKPYVCSFEGCYKRFSQSSNLSAHEKTHYLPKGDENSATNNNESSVKKEHPSIVAKKKIFKVIHATQLVEKPKPIVILDRHRYLEKMMEEHKKMEEKKKLEEEEKAKKELEVAEKIKEQVEIIPEKKLDVININEIENNAAIVENQPILAKENIKEENNQEIKIKDVNVAKKTKDNLFNDKSDIELKNNNKIKSSTNNNSANPSNNSQIYLKQEVLKSLENLPTERKIKEKMELNNLLKNLNYVEEDIINEQTEMNFEIPYYLTKEWVVKNLLS